MTAPREGPDPTERVRLMRDGLVNCSDYLVSGTIGIFLVPLMLKGLGAEAYGLLLAAAAAAGMAEMLDCGLDFSVTREVAAAEGGKERGETERFVLSAGNAYVVIGIAGAVLVAALGLPLSGGLHLSALNRRIAPVVFGLAGISFLADRLTLFAMSVLRGLRRFDAANQVGIAGAFLRAAGTVGLLAAGAGLAPIAAWQTAASASAAFVAMAAIRRIEPRYRFRLGSFDWDILRPFARPGLAAACALGISAVFWQMPQLLPGVVGGAAWIAQYHIAQKFPRTILSISGRAAETLFPAASRHGRARDMSSVREILEAGTRWTVALALPLCLVLWILAPELLRAWLGEARPETVRILRLTVATVFADAIAAGPMEVLWGCGITRTAVAIFLGLTAAEFLLGLYLLHQIGIAGAAWGMLLTMSCGSFAFVHFGSRACGVRRPRLIRATFSGLPAPAAACAAVTLGFSHFIRLDGWAGVIGAAAAGGTAYAAGLYFCGGRQEERMFADQLLSLPANALRSAYPGLPGTSSRARW